MIDLQHPDITRLRRYGYETADDTEPCCALCGDPFESGDYMIEWPKAKGWICKCCFEIATDDLGMVSDPVKLGLDVQIME